MRLLMASLTQWTCLSKLQEIVKDREAWRAAVRGVTNRHLSDLTTVCLGPWLRSWHATWLQVGYLPPAGSEGATSFSIETGCMGGGHHMGAGPCLQGWPFLAATPPPCYLTPASLHSPTHLTAPQSRG